MLAVLVLAVAAMGAALLPRSAAAQDANRIEVDLSERTLVVYSDNQVMNTFPVAVGEDGQETPKGEFTIDRIVWNPDWVPPDVEWAEDKTRQAPGDPDNPMRGAKLYFAYPDYYIHGTDEPETIGEAASKGCLRMKPIDAENLAEWVQKVGGETRSDAWFSELRASDTDMREITLPDPLQIIIRA